MELRSGKGFVHDIDEIIGEYGVGKMEIDLRKDLVSRNVCSDLVAIAIMLQNVTGRIQRRLRLQFGHLNFA